MKVTTTQSQWTRRKLAPVKLLKNNKRSRPSIPQWMDPKGHAAIDAAPKHHEFVALFKG